MKDKPLRLAMLGMIPGNGHPYSWSAIINGYDREAMARCPYAAIPAYLDAQPFEEVFIPGVEVTHIWTDQPEEAALVAKASRIPHVVERMEDVIGEVDAVIVSTDDGSEHVWRARPFIEAGLPVFVDKPLATTTDELAQFIAWKHQGARILSSSGIRYAEEISGLKSKDWQWVTATMGKTWEKYGIHSLEPLGVILGRGFEEVRLDKNGPTSIITIRHRSGATATIAMLPEAMGSFGVIHGYGKDGHDCVKCANTYHAFRTQLLTVIDWLRTGQDPFSFDETVEYMAVIIAGIKSRQDGQWHHVSEVLDEVSHAL